MREPIAIVRRDAARIDAIATTSAAELPAAAAKIACHHCGTVHERVALPPRRVAACRRCGLFLYAHRPEGLARSLALHLSAAVTLILAHAFPLLAIEVQGIAVQATLLTGTRALFDQGLWPVAVACLLLGSLLPAARITLGTLVLMAARRGRPSALARWAYRLTRLQGPWSMLEVYLFGLLVAYVKLLAYAQIVVGVAAIALFLTVLLLAWAESVVEPDDVWERIGRPVPRVAGRGAACHDCGFIAPPGADHCPRCDAAVHRRKTRSLQRTWALLVTAMLLYVPANLYPMMIVTQFGNAHPGTILGGVVELIAYGDYPVALVIFVASVLVPVLKFLALIFLLASVHLRSTRRLRQKTKLYVLVEWIGRWSMVDVFVVAILAGLVQVGSLFVITAGVGAIAFCAVVVLTMLAAMTFDSRLLWDSLDDVDDRV